jgi:hypothetical protein
MFQAIQIPLVLLGTFVPVIGIGITLVLGFALTGKKRWMAFWIVPILTLGICVLIAKPVAYNGNLLFAALFGLLFVGLFIYYPVLLVISLIVFLKKRKQDNQKVPNT